MVTDFRKSFIQIKDACLPEVDLCAITRHKLRHTYTAARLQTLDNGAPIQIFTVQHELGHSDTEMITKICGHLGKAAPPCRGGRISD